jgi:hypothetical protein
VKEDAVLGPGRNLVTPEQNCGCRIRWIRVLLDCEVRS